MKPAGAEPSAPGPPKTMLVLLAGATMIGASGLAAGGTAGALVGTRLAGTDAAAGLPLAVLVLGSAAAAILISRATPRIGRGCSLALGYALGALGAGTVLLAAVATSFAALLGGSALLGAANAAIFLTRYAGAAIGGPAERGRALGAVFLGTAVGAVLSAALLGPSGRLATTAGFPRDCGLYLVAVGAFTIAGLMLAALSSPRLPRVGGHAALLGPTGDERLDRDELRRGLSAGSLGSTLLVLAATNLVMVAVMAVAPIHLRMHATGLRLVGVVIALHVAGMFAPAPITGWLADRRGGATVAALGLALLTATGLGGWLLGETQAGAITLLLVLLGVGWNLGVVGASTLLVSAVPSSLRPHLEGIGEVAMGIAAAVGAPLAGALTHAAGLSTLWLASAAIAASALVVLHRAHVSTARPAPRPAAPSTTRVER